MATGITTTGALADSLPTVIHAARIVREYEGTFMRVTENHTLPEGTGLTYNEIDLAALSAQDITETTILDNPQQLSDSLLSITPTVIGIQTIVTDRTMRRISKATVAKMGVLGQNAIQRKKNDGYLTLIQSGATTASPGAGASWTIGHVEAAKFNATSNATEGSMGAIYAVHHGFALKDLVDEITGGVGTYPIASGMTEDVFKKGMVGMAVGVTFFEDGNITIDSSSDAYGAVHPREAVLHIQGHSPRTETRRRPEIGGGADEMFMYDEDEFGERSSGNWLYAMLCDATAPTS